MSSFPAGSLGWAIPSWFCGDLRAVRSSRALGEFMKRTRTVALAVLAVALAGVGCLFLPPIGFFSHRDPEIKNFTNVRQLAVCCQAFGVAHSGRYPTSLEELVPEILKEEQMEKVGYYWDSVSGRRYDYLYFPGLGMDSDPRLPLIAAPGPVHGMRIVVQADLSQDRVPEAKFMAMKRQYCAQPHGGVERPSAAAPGRRSP